MMQSDDWESLCNACGSCCFEKIEDERGTIFYTQTPCRYLDVVTRQCRIYENRFAINPECIKLTPDLVSSLHWLSPDCGYRRQNVPDMPVEQKWRGKRRRNNVRKQKKPE